MKINVSSVCKVGGRDYNQDYLSVFSDERAAALVVCDGLGSYFGSDIASRITATSVTTAFSELAASSKINNPINPDTIAKYCKLAHNAVISAKNKQPLIKSCCTTIAGFFTNFKSSIVAHIGDSRVLFFRDNKLFYFTTDHSMAQIAVEEGEILREEIPAHKDQNKLTRVLGSDFYSPPDIAELGELKSGDKIIVCTDGFWEYVLETEMPEILRKAASPQDALDLMEALLLDRVENFNDNYSAIVAFVTE